jgi:hypothetical protein
MASAQDQQEAKGHFKRGEALYKAKRFKQAAESYELAYQRLPLPAFLFNIGQCYRNLGRAADAVDLFKRYLEDAPEAPNRRRVEELLEELEPKARAERLTEPPPTRPTAVSGAGSTSGAAGHGRDPDEAGTSSAAATALKAGAGADLQLPQPPPSRGSPGVVDTLPNGGGESPPSAAPPQEAEGRPIWRRWWFWAGAGAATAGGAVALIVLLSGRLPSSDLGNVDIRP